MAAQYLVNIAIQAGNDFKEMYYLVNPDMSPRDITHCVIEAKLAKHSRAFDAITSTVDQMVYIYSPFKCYVEDGIGGVFSLNMSAQDTNKLEEGKYVYSASLKDINGFVSEVVSGLIFVNIAFGHNNPINTI